MNQAKSPTSLCCDGPLQELACDRCNGSGVEVDFDVTEDPNMNVSPVFACLDCKGTKVCHYCEGCQQWFTQVPQRYGRKPHVITVPTPGRLRLTMSDDPNKETP